MKHFGVKAQELQEVLPMLVYEDPKGELSVNYIELIPMLISAVSELKTENEMLKAAILGDQQAKVSQSDALAMEGYQIDQAILYQNTPNPFSENTTIRYALPAQTNQADIYTFDMQGLLINQLALDPSKSEVELHGGSLKAGMYLYSLMVDGKEMDTKRMILTR